MYLTLLTKSQRLVKFLSLEIHNKCDVIMDLILEKLWMVQHERDVIMDLIIDFNLKLGIPFRCLFRFGHWNEIFRYQSIPAFRFGFTANIIYIYIYIFVFVI